MNQDFTREWQERIWRACIEGDGKQTGCEFFIWGYKGRDGLPFLRTKDELDSASPYKPFPDLPYLRFIIRELQANRRILIPKSRQVMVTWICLAFIFWEVLFHPASRWFLQGKKEDDSEELLKRIDVMYDSLPEWMQSWADMTRKFCSREFPTLDAVIKGIPQGGDHFKSFTPRGIFIDEAQIHTELANALMSGEPILKDIGWMIIVGSARAGAMYNLVMDKGAAMNEAA